MAPAPVLVLEEESLAGAFWLAAVLMLFMSYMKSSLLAENYAQMILTSRLSVPSTGQTSLKSFKIIAPNSISQSFKALPPPSLACKGRAPRGHLARP